MVLDIIPGFRLLLAYKTKNKKKSNQNCFLLYIVLLGYLMPWALGRFYFYDKNHFTNLVVVVKNHAFFLLIHQIDW